MARIPGSRDAERIPPDGGRPHARRPGRLRRAAAGVALVLLVAIQGFGDARGAEGARAARPSEPAPRLSASARPPGPRFAATGEPLDLYDLAGWLEFKSRHHLGALPSEARLFHRLALLAAESGQPEQAQRLMRGASELDPSFVAPHLSLASWSLTREPSQALLQYATVIDLARRNFMLQLALAANAIYLCLQAMFLGLLAAGLLVIAIRVHALRHPWEERLGRWLSPETARWWSWSFVVLPFLCGFGPVLPTLALLGMLWPNFRFRERALTVTLALAAAATPWTATMLDRLAAPLDGDRAPLYGVPMIEHQGWTAERDQRLARLAVEHPGNPYVKFALAWAQRLSGDAAGAEASYRGVLEHWPNDARTVNNLGNALAMQGRAQEALETYLKATTLDPQNAAAWFNASQIYTQRFEYRSATDALARASVVDFEMVKNYQAQGSDGSLALVDEWIAPRTFWSALTEVSGSTGGRSLPPSWRGRFEASGWTFSAVAGAVTVLGIAIGIWLHRGTPLRSCSNCGRVVCRRCARRRRELALCPDCADIETRAESPDFARVLLSQRQRRVLARERMMRTAGATLIPGFGLLARQHVVTPVLLLSVSAALLSGYLQMAPPFGYEPRLLTADQGVPLPVIGAMWPLVFIWSLLGYFRIEARARAQAKELAAPVKSRVTQATRQQPSQAA